MTNFSVFINGASIELFEPLTAGELLVMLAIQRKGVAIALNGGILPRSEWDQQRITEGDRIEIVTAAAGG
jgi:sulfur carrier protein